MSEEGKPMRAVGHRRGAIGGGSGISDLDFHREKKKGHERMQIIVISTMVRVMD